MCSMIKQLRFPFLSSLLHSRRMLEGYVENSLVLYSHGMAPIFGEFYELTKDHYEYDILERNCSLFNPTANDRRGSRRSFLEVILGNVVKVRNLKGIANKNGLTVLDYNGKAHEMHSQIQEQRKRKDMEAFSKKKSKMAELDEAISIILGIDDLKEQLRKHVHNTVWHMVDLAASSLTEHVILCEWWLGPMQGRNAMRGFKKQNKGEHLFMIISTETLQLRR